MIYINVEKTNNLDGLEQVGTNQREVSSGGSEQEEDRVG